MSHALFYKLYLIRSAQQIVVQYLYNSVDEEGMQSFNHTYTNLNFDEDHVND